MSEINKYILILILIVTVSCGDSEEENTESSTIQSTSATNNSSTDTDTNTDEETELSLTATNTNISRSEVITLSASGGQSPYVYSIYSGGGTLNTTDDTYTAPNADGTVVLMVTDNLGAVAYLYVYVSATSLTASVSASEIDVLESIKINVAGGTSPYTYTLVQGAGQMTGAYYYSPATETTAKIRVEDADGATAVVTIKVLNVELKELCEDFSGSLVKVAGKYVCSLPVADDATDEEQAECPSEWMTLTSSGVPYTITKKVQADSLEKFWGYKIKLETGRHSSFKAKARECVSVCKKRNILNQCTKRENVCAQVTNIACTL